jgi:hypothetical protein
LKLGGHVYTHTTNGHHAAETWTVRIKLSQQDYINLSREFDTELPSILARFTDAIGKVLPMKAAEMLRSGNGHINVSIADGQAQSPTE